MHSMRSQKSGGRVGRRALTIGLLAAVLAPAWSDPARGEEAIGGAPGDWMSRYAGARTVGFGGAFVATADDAFAALWNPAGLTQLDQNEVFAETSRMYEDISVNGLSFVVPGSRLPTFGISVLSLSSGSFQKTDVMNNDLGTFSNTETGFLFSAARPLSPRLSVGANVKVMRQNVEEWSAGGVGLDVGGLYHLTPTVRVGASVMNLGGPSLTLRDAEESYPTEVRAGFTAMLLNGRGLLSAQFDQVEGAGLRMHGGGEYWIQPMVALRLGYNDSYAAGGFSYRFQMPMQFDYGVSDHPLGMVHRVGLSYRFGGFSASSRAEPAVFSPTGENAVTKIHLKSRTKATTDSWNLTIVNKSEEVVRRFGGKGVPPAHLLWDGKDETGMPLPDGTYRYRLVVIDAEGRELHSTTRMVEIFTSGPQGTVPVIPLDGTTPGE